jgi:hypothetical protein
MKNETRVFMLTKYTKWAAMVALLGCLLWPMFASRAMLPFAVAAAAVVVLVQAAKMGEYRWVAAFVVVACVFNPVVPVEFPRFVAVILDGITILLFGLSVLMLKTPPRFSIPSITDRMPGSESL